MRELLEKAAACISDTWCDRWKKELLEEIDAELEKPEFEPAAWQFKDIDGNWCNCLSKQHYENSLRDGWEVRKLYANPPRQQEPLTDKEILDLLDDAGIMLPARVRRAYEISIARVIERAHGIGGEK